MKEVIYDCTGAREMERDLSPNEASLQTTAEQAARAGQAAILATIQSRQAAIAALKSQAATNPLIAQIVAAMGW